MSTLILAVTTLLLYSLGIIQQTLVVRGRLPSQRRMALIIGLLGLLAHGALVADLVWTQAGLNLSLFESGVLISALIVALGLSLSLSRAVGALLLIIYPLALASILAAITFSSSPKIVDQSAYGVLTHVVLAVAAYSLFLFSGIQALLLYIQNRQLKAHRQNALILSLPALQTMEALLFALVRGGVVLLTLAIISGTLFMEDLFAQHLAHKTVFSLLAWGVFTGLLAGHHLFGWRGAVASRWTLMGCLFLTLGYFGSKLALQLIGY
ncbi:MAG: cytochrome c biogenesis protein CcsA [Oleiphilaceae bacterium]|nr:cytochrome c biogenesis protein CcsA [Oleiphilaceae bacterium]